MLKTVKAGGAPRLTIQDAIDLLQTAAADDREAAA
jgi:hypothetical protein